MAAWNPQANEIFLRAVEFSAPEERQAFLDEACQGNDSLRAEVDALLTASQQAGSFLESPAPGLTAAIDASQISEQPGSVIGPYKLLEQIGEGGMGVVFMAEQQEPVRRRVALKLIKPGMDTRQVIARFEAERQALAVMDHPSIARVLDAGTTPSGHPYFVMELVRGVPITAYCDEGHLSIRDRLELFASVCQAIQHAHNKGIVHRDIKPTNVLITRQDGRPVVKVIDFGVAKAMGQQLTEKTLFTNFAQMIGTPLYMSPEQAERSGVDIDTRSDVYSLGVLLYELLTGTTPVDAEQIKLAAFEEIRRIIREDEPPTPSSRISGSQTLPAIAAHRHIEPARLSKLVRGELDWIVMKSLEKDRNRRYETANAFAADLLHYLNDEAVQACPPSAAYRLSKFARRNRVALTTAAMVAIALVAGTVVSTWQAIRAETARQAEAEQRTLAEAAQAAEAEQRKIAEAERSEAEKHRIAAEANYHKAKAAVDKYFTLVSESTLLDVPGMQPLRKDLLESALQFYEGAALERTSDPAILIDVASTHLRVSSIYLALDRADDFIAAVRRALDVVDRLRREHLDAADHEHKLAGFWNGTRWTQTGMSPPRDMLGALQTMARLEKTWQELAEKHPSELGFPSDLSYVQSTVGTGLTAVGRVKDSTPYFRRSLANCEKVVLASPNSPQYRSALAQALQYLGRNLKLLGNQHEEVVKLMRRSREVSEALLADFPSNPTYRASLADHLRALAEQITDDNRQEAQESLQRSAEISESLVREFPDFHPYIHTWSGAISHLATIKRSLSDATEAEAAAQEVLGAIEAQLQMRPNDRNMRKELVLWCFQAAKDYARFADLSEKLHRRALAEADLLVLAFPDHPVSWKIVLKERRGHCFRYLGWIARDTKRPDEALECFDKSVAEFQQLAEIVDPARRGECRDFEADSLLQKVGILAAAGRADEAEQMNRRVVEVYQSLVQEFPQAADFRQKLANTFTALAQLFAGRGDTAHAEEAYRYALGEFDRLATAQPKVPDWWRMRASFQRQLAQMQAAAGRADEAQRTYQEAIDSYQKVASEFPKYEDLWRVYIGLSQALVAANRTEQVDEALRKAVELAPNNSGVLNSYAWGYATASDLNARNVPLALALAQKGVQVDSKNLLLTNTLGVAHYRAGNWQEAIDWLMKSVERRNGGDSFDWFFLAMAHWQLGHQDEARDWQSKAVAWMEEHQHNDEQLVRFKAEAEELIKQETVEAAPAPEAKTEDK